MNLAHSYARCDRLARREAGNFYHAFRILPRRQRLAMSALYAFFRLTDNLSDGPGSPDEKRAPLAAWREQFRRAMAGHYLHWLHPALHDAITCYNIPYRYFEDVLDGVEMDLAPIAFATFDDLYAYCYRVASAVGLACIRIWGCADERALGPAESAGIAFQLTNILRDLGEDAQRGRVYLPNEDLVRFGCKPAELVRGDRSDAFRTLMRFEIERARRYYEKGWQLRGFLPGPGRAVFQVMLQTYRGLLDTIERRDYDVFSQRISLSKWHKLGLALGALPVRWGLS